MKNKEWKIIFFFLLILNFGLFLGEIFLVGMSSKDSFIMRLCTVVIDGIFIGVYTYLRLAFRRILKKYLKNLFFIMYIADTLAVILVFYLLYVIRLIVLFEVDEIDRFTMINGIYIAFLSALVGGWFMGYMQRKIKKKMRKRKRNVNVS